MTRRCAGRSSVQLGGLFISATIVSAGAIAQPTGGQFFIYDGQQYQSKDLPLASDLPVQVREPQRQRDGSYAIPRASDGHFYVAGSVNGFPVLFMIDTGAKFTSIPDRIAANAGIRAGRVSDFNTAAGRTQGALATGNLVRVGPFSVPRATVAIMPRLDAPLLGVDVLNRFQITTVNGYMLLRAVQPLDE